ncbi:hypothetical protein GCM10010260_67720 [Streptomyces filipinensis]|uniref:Uncharacterized protein n=1 Tax=Streptomyces filipinensis TaxID=66887 RepID=A0A918MF56_9ACTN|nr:hypothetical protein [Streptomyces filipinensis]GGV18367.1 hypothetical protein GCM10010260_67720 [Streptomyces filipinensis]
MDLAQPAAAAAWAATGAMGPNAAYRNQTLQYGDAASSAYAAVYGSLSRRRIPVTAVPARVRSDITPEVRLANSPSSR